MSVSHSASSIKELIYKLNPFKSLKGILPLLMSHYDLKFKHNISPEKLTLIVAVFISTTSDDWLISSAIESGDIGAAKREIGDGGPAGLL